MSSAPLIAFGSDYTGPARRNASRCAVELRDHGPSTISELAERTGLSRPTVAAALTQLADHGIVSEGLTEQQRGRPARQFRFLHESGALIGVDAGAHTVRAVMADLRGDTIADVEIPSEGLVAHERFNAVCEAIRGVMHQNERGGRQIHAIGVGVSGLVGRDGVLTLSTRYPDWQGVDLAGRLSAEFGSAAVVENDINLAAFAETRLGSAQLFDDVLYLSLGHQISMGVVIGGRIRHGSHNAAGEISRQTFDVALDDDGNIAWRAGASAADVFAAAVTGDVTAREELSRFMKGIGEGMAVLSLALDPDAIVLGGGLVRAGTALVAPLAAEIQARITIPAVPTIVASGLGADAVAYGALLRAAERGTHLLLGKTAIAPTIRRRVR